MQLWIRKTSGFAGKAALVAALVVAAGGQARAAEMCITSAEDIVLKNFKMPHKGKCRPIAGFERIPIGPTPVATGSVCVAQNGSRIDFAVSVMTLVMVPPDQRLVARHHLIRIDVPSMTGIDWETQGNGWGQSQSAFGPCVPGNVVMP